MRADQVSTRVADDAVGDPLFSATVMGDAAADLTCERRLGDEDRAALATALVVAGERAPQLLGRIAGDRGVRLAAAANGLLALDHEARERRIAEAVREITAETPAYLELVHASWIEAALVGEPEAVRVMVAVAPAGAVAVAPALRRWLRRRAFAGLVAMPAPDSGSPAVRSPMQLEAAFVATGRRRLAIAVQAAPREAVRLLAARLGVHAEEFLAESRIRAAAGVIGAAVRELGDLGGAIAAGGAHDADALLFRAGARHLAPALADAGGELLRQVAQRLVRPLGLVLLEESARARPAAGTAAAGSAALLG